MSCWARTKRISEFTFQPVDKSQKADIISIGIGKIRSVWSGVMDLSKVCNALGNETRYQIVKAMKDQAIGTCCDKIQYFEDGISVADVVATTGLAQSTVSQHLMVLEQAGIILREKRGQWTCFFLNKGLLEEFSGELHKAFCQ